MAYLIIGIVIAAFSILFALSGCQSTSRHKPSTKELAARGRERAKQYAIEDLGMFFHPTCYVVAWPQTVSYGCPTCGRTTIYPFSSSPGFVQPLSVIQYRLMPSILKNNSHLNGITFEIDESQFCQFCSPEITDPKLGLIVYYEGRKEPYRIWGVDGEDLILIAEFLTGKKEHIIGDSKTPIEEHYGRLNELLDLKLKSPDVKDKN